MYVALSYRLTKGLWSSWSWEGLAWKCLWNGNKRSLPHWAQQIQSKWLSTLKCEINDYLQPWLLFNMHCLLQVAKRWRPKAKLDKWKSKKEDRFTLPPRPVWGRGNAAFIQPIFLFELLPYHSSAPDLHSLPHPTQISHCHCYILCRTGIKSPPHPTPSSSTRPNKCLKVGCCHLGNRIILQGLRLYGPAAFHLGLLFLLPQKVTI